MIVVLKASKELTKIENYKLTKSHSVKLIKDLTDGDTIKPDIWCLYADEDKDVEILSIMDVDGTVFACQSNTFKKSFFDIAEIFGDDDFVIKKISGVTKAGRDFVDCDLAM